MHLATNVRETLVRAIQDLGSREIAAFLLQLSDGSQDVWVMNNRSGAANHVVVLPSEVHRIEREACRYGACILAFIHSHFFDLIPSDEDWIGIVATGIPWLIVCYKDDLLQYQLFSSYIVKSKKR